MSLARNPNMPYAVAGKQERPYERMSVRSNVYVPDADVCADCDGRPAYTAPAGVRREPYRISMKAVVLIVAAAAFVLGMFYVSALAKRAGVYKAGQQVYNEIQTLNGDIIVIQEQIAQAQDPNKLRYEASQRLKMINSEGVTPIEIFAPETRPAQAENSLSAGAARASMEP